MSSGQLSAFFPDDSNLGQIDMELDQTRGLFFLSPRHFLYMREMRFDWGVSREDFVL